MPSLYWFRRWITPLYSPHPYGRHLAEKVGLPESYAQPVAPSTGSPPALVPPPSGPADKPQSPAASLPDIEQALLQARPEDSSHFSTTEKAAPNQTTTNGEVMRATTTDIQQASSSHDEPMDHDMDHDTDAEANGQDGRKGARQDLVEKAKEAFEVHVRDAAESPTPMCSTALPMDVELNNGSGGEGDGPSGGTSSNCRRLYPHIPEKEHFAAPHGHVDHHIGSSLSIQPSERFIVPSPVSTSPHPESEINEDATTGAGAATVTPFSHNEQARIQENNSLVPSPVSPPGVRGISNGISGNDVANTSFLELPASPLNSHTSGLQEGAGSLPLSTASWNGPQHGRSISSATSSTLVATSSSLSTTRSADLSTTRKSRSVDPVEWTVDEVVDWLCSKGFDEMVCDKFTEQEITGDILFELDSATLKSEFGTIPFGKRIRIARAITDLLRPPSIQPSSVEQHTGPGSLSQGSPFAPQDILLGPMAQSSPNRLLMGRKVSEDLTRPSVPVYPATDPGVRSDATEFHTRTTSANTNGGFQSGANEYHSRTTSANSNGGIHSDVTRFYSRTASANSNGGVQSDAWKRPPRFPALGANAMEEDSGVLSDNVTKNLGTKIRGFLFSLSNSSSPTSKLPSSHVSKKATRLFARQRR